MSFNGSGTFVINTAGQPVVANTVISATVFNALTADLATGLSTCITKDGQTTPTANIPMGNNKLTGLGAATAATDAATLGQVQSTAAKLITVTGTDTITGTMSPALTAYAAGQLFYFIANAANTGAMTINIDGLGAKSITRDGSTALIAGDVASGEIVVICYDGTRFQMINAANSFGNTTINGTLTVTGNTALQANVSIVSALSVGGAFAVTGAATLGSTLAVTGKSDLPTVSTASMNAAVALITTGTVTNLTSTSASVASINAAVALITTGTITALTVTGASVASANVGTAVVTGLTVTNASIASLNAGTATVTTGNLTFSSTGQRITGDMSNATLASRLAFQTSTTNGVTNVGAIPNGTAVSSGFRAYGGSDPNNATFGQIIQNGSSDTQIRSDISGTGTYAPITFYTGGSERMRLDTSGNLGIGVTPTYKLDVVSGTADVARFTVLNKTIDGTGNIQVFTSNNQAADLGGSIALGGKNGSGGVFDPWAFGVIKGAKENSTSSNLAGYLAFATANSGGTVSECMRIDSSGNVGIGGTAGASAKVQVLGTLPTSSNLTSSISLSGTIPSGTTNQYWGVRSFPTTQAASFALSELKHFVADPQAFGAGSTVTSQYGFLVESTLTGAANNYGFFSNIASGSNRWNFYANGTAQNYFAGDTLIGTSTNATAITTRFLTKASAAYAAAAVFESDGSAANWARTDWKNANIATPGIIYMDQAGLFSIRNDGNYPIAFYTNGGNERMRIDSSGNVGIGGTAGATTKLDVLGTLPSSSNTSLGLNVRGTIPSSSTAFALSYQSNTSVENASFTLTNWIHFGAYQGTKGASATVTNQFGFLVDSSLTGATNNFGFYSNIASGSNRWNFYAAGTAANYFAGNTGIGVAPSYALQVASPTGTTNGVRLTNAGTGTYLGLGLRYTGVGSDDNAYIQASSSMAFLAPGYRFTSGETSTTVVLTIGSDGSLTAPNVYDDTVGATNRDLYIDNTGVIGYVSSIRASKTNIQNLADVSWLKSLTPVSYQYRKKDADGSYTSEADGGIDYGLIAEDVEAVAPELCFYDTVDGNSELRGVTYSKLITPMLKYIQQLESRIAALEAR